MRGLGIAVFGNGEKGRSFNLPVSVRKVEKDANGNRRIEGVSEWQDHGIPWTRKDQWGRVVPVTKADLAAKDRKREIERSRDSALEPIVKDLAAGNLYDYFRVSREKYREIAERGWIDLDRRDLKAGRPILLFMFSEAGRKLHGDPIPARVVWKGNTPKAAFDKFAVEKSPRPKREIPERQITPRPLAKFIPPPPIELPAGPIRNANHSGASVLRDLKDQALVLARSEVPVIRSMHGRKANAQGRDLAVGDRIVSSHNRSYVIEGIEDGGYQKIRIRLRGEAAEGFEPGQATWSVRIGFQDPVFRF